MGLLYFLCIFAVLFLRALLGRSVSAPWPSD